MLYIVMSMVLNHLQPVSYTHLDVYKRQEVQYSFPSLLHAGGLMRFSSVPGTH